MTVACNRPEVGFNRGHLHQSALFQRSRAQCSLVGARRPRPTVSTILAPEICKSVDCFPQRRPLGTYPHFIPEASMCNVQHGVLCKDRTTAIPRTTLFGDLRPAHRPRCTLRMQVMSLDRARCHHDLPVRTPGLGTGTPAIKSQSGPGQIRIVTSRTWLTTRLFPNVDA